MLLGLGEVQWLLAITLPSKTKRNGFQESPRNAYQWRVAFCSLLECQLYRLNLMLYPCAKSHRKREWENGLLPRDFQVGENQALFYSGSDSQKVRDCWPRGLRKFEVPSLVGHPQHQDKKYTSEGGDANVTRGGSAGRGGGLDIHAQGRRSKVTLLELGGACCGCCWSFCG